MYNIIFMKIVLTLLSNVGLVEPVTATLSAGTSPLFGNKMTLTDSSKFSTNSKNSAIFPSLKLTRRPDQHFQSIKATLRDNSPADNFNPIERIKSFGGSIFGNIIEETKKNLHRSSANNLHGIKPLTLKQMIGAVDMESLGIHAHAIAFIIEIYNRKLRNFHGETSRNDIRKLGILLYYMIFHQSIKWDTEKLQLFENATTEAEVDDLAKKLVEEMDAEIVYLHVHFTMAWSKKIDKFENLKNIGRAMAWFGEDQSMEIIQLIELTRALLLTDINGKEVEKYLVGECRLPNGSLAKNDVERESWLVYDMLSNVFSGYASQMKWKDFKYEEANAPICEGFKKRFIFF